MLSATSGISMCRQWWLDYVIPNDACIMGLGGKGPDGSLQMLVKGEIKNHNPGAGTDPGTMYNSHVFTFTTSNNLLLF